MISPWHPYRPTQRMQNDRGGVPDSSNSSCLFLLVVDNLSTKDWSDLFHGCSPVIPTSPHRFAGCHDPNGSVSVPHSTPKKLRKGSVFNRRGYATFSPNNRRGYATLIGGVTQLSENPVLLKATTTAMLRLYSACPLNCITQTITHKRGGRSRPLVCFFSV